MDETPKPLDAMSCEELLRELARLTVRHDRDTADVMGNNTSSAASHGTLADERDRLNCVAALLKEKGCEDAAS
jgi:hypothetical protein